MNSIKKFNTISDLVISFLPLFDPKSDLRILFHLHLFTGLGPCLPNNFSTYGARRFHISRSEWDRVFSRLTVVPAVCLDFRLMNKKVLLAYLLE